MISSEEKHSHEVGTIEDYVVHQANRGLAEGIMERCEAIDNLLDAVSQVEQLAIEASNLDFRYAENKITRRRIIAELTVSINAAQGLSKLRKSNRIVQADIDALFQIPKSHRAETIKIFFRVIKHYLDYCMELNGQNSLDAKDIVNTTVAMQSRSTTIEQLIEDAQKLNDVPKFEYHQKKSSLWSWW